MKIKDIYDLIDLYAPFSLSDELCAADDCYDNSGVIVEHNDDISGIVFTLDLDAPSIALAEKNGANLIVTHHPSIYRPIKKIDGALYDSARLGIGVISAHLNLDCAVTGVDALFAKALGADKTTVLERIGDGGYGRRFTLSPTIFGEFVENVEKRLCTKTFAFGEKTDTVSTIASFCGAGLGEREIDLAEADVYCSSDIPHHVLVYAARRNKKIVQFTHYASEILGIKGLYEHFSELKEIKEENLKTYFSDNGYFSQSE